ncbi:cupin domain-containing protein [Butyrivibrio sp. AE3004]|uniref:cupin domain-containing protein n=1 Tax=Butyrivibrio sp. AE3004 TaxID=1506994 RepID=UPI00068EA7B5|nr:cupin domain-containing protein [Butyrivibrio sp. AE3004]
MERAEYLKQKYHLEKHPEGGCFAEVYTAPFSHEDRSLMGSIYFLLEGEDISHFHQIDCDEIWYHHEGCGLKITMIIDGSVSEAVIGPDDDQLAMVVIPKAPFLQQKTFIRVVSVLCLVQQLLSLLMMDSDLSWIKR